MSISREQVLHVAKLSRLRLSDEEVETMARELNGIFEHIERIGELDLEGVEPTTHVVEVANALRADEPKPSLDRDVVFAQAPATQDGGFLVPSPGAS